MTPTPDRQLTPRAMPLLARRLDDTISKIEAWAGISVSPSSRLHDAVGVLRAVDPTRDFPRSRSDLTQIAHAVRDAQNFETIRYMLGSEKPQPVVTTLDHAIGGELGKTPHRAHQAQSELWVIAMVAAGGTPPGIVSLKADGTSPDVVITNGTKEYSVEVKRPQSLGHVRNIVSRAARQLLPKQADWFLHKTSRFHGGALVLDLTDCLSPGWAVRFERGPPVLAPLREQHIPLARRVHQQIFCDALGKMRDRRRHIFATNTLLRISWWDLGDLSRLHCLNQVFRCVYLPEGMNCKNLRYHRAHWLAHRIQDGLRGVGVEHLDDGEIRFDS